jgi:Protein of unknown function (DUF3160).
MRIVRSLAIVGIVSLAFVSCGKDPPRNGELRHGTVALDMKQYQLPTKAFRSDAHQRYLKDPMAFAQLPDQGLKGGKTAVVGSKVCHFYPGAKLGSAADLASLGAGVPLPFGSILPILGEGVKDSGGDADKGGMFNFQDNWNWFYPTSFKGRKGLVFGADLYGLGDTNEQNRISARLYQSGGAYGEFYPILGYKPLAKDVQARLASDRLAWQSVGKNEYYLSMERPDDMISLYMGERSTYFGDDADKRNMTPLFVSTDLVAHAQHLVFDRLLQYEEENSFVPRLAELCDALIAKLETRKDSASAYTETLEKAELYLKVAKALLELAPERVKTEGENSREETKYVSKDPETVLAAYPEALRSELAKMDKAGGFEDSAVFSFADGAAWKEDYSQYKPRGHYAKNGVLSAYFRAMTWFGRANFLIGVDPRASENDAKLARDMAPIAFLLTDVVADDRGLLDSWSRLFDPITALIGLSDDISFKELLPLWASEGPGSTPFASWISDEGKVEAFRAKAQGRLRPPAISGSSIDSGSGVAEGSRGESRASGSSEEAGAPLLAWRLFGQRFTWDSYVHEKLSPPRLYDRDMVRGLDIMKAFGSRTADLLLSDSDYPKVRRLKETLDGIEKDFDARGSEFWQSNYYNNALYEIKTQAQFEPGAGFYFTETPAWGIKAMLASHGTWAELRHDTILYTKQVYAERAGDGDFNPTFRTEPIPKPVHYLEPDIPFWQGAVTSVQTLASTLDAFGLMDEESAGKLKRLQELCVKAVEVSQAEARDEALDRKAIDWIPTIPAELADLCLLHQEGGSADEDQLKMALVADVYTNAELEQVLETGVGIPYRLYVALNDGQGGKRIAVGYTYSYYEFGRPMGNRMTDEEWKKIAYEPNAKLDDFLPFWASGVALPAAKAK